jgi:hypothetical protein
MLRFMGRVHTSVDTVGVGTDVHLGLSAIAKYVHAVARSSLSSIPLFLFALRDRVQRFHLGLSTILQYSVIYYALHPARPRTIT